MGCGNDNANADLKACLIRGAWAHMIGPVVVGRNPQSHG
jgi:hypothetical protein